jgi:hypothetical protein
MEDIIRLHTVPKLLKWNIFTGTVTESQKTLIADGITTVFSTAVFGTLLDGKYVQLVTTGIQC